MDGIEKRDEYADSNFAHPESISVAMETEKCFESLRRLAHEKTGLFPAVDTEIKTVESQEDHMQKAWIRDSAFILILLKQVMETPDGSQNGSYEKISEFAQLDLKKILNFLNQPRWLDRFRQKIIDEGTHTRLSGYAPEVHMETDGRECIWDQNQPEAWAELLIATGITESSDKNPDYSAEEMTTIRAIAEYLVNIKAWKFAGAGMWEGLPCHSPSSRSSAIAIAKGLETVAPLFKNDEIFYQKITNAIQDTMNFVKQDINHDYTFPDGHPDGADLAMLATMILPGSPATRLSFAKYVEENGEKLGIGALPGAIRFKGDEYKKGELGEARWFMANPILAIGYFDEAKQAIENNNLELAIKYRDMGLEKLNQARDISAQYGHDRNLYPELFIQRDPNKVRDEHDVLEMKEGDKTIALQPLKRSLLWNSALMMLANNRAQELNSLIHTHQEYSHSVAA